VPSWRKPKALVQGHGTPVVGEHGEFQAQQLRPVVGVVTQGLHQRRAHALPLGVLAHADAQHGRVASAQGLGRVQPGAAHQLAAALGHELQIGAAGRGHVFDACAPHLFSRQGQLHQVGEDIGVAHHLRKTGGVGRPRTAHQHGVCGADGAGDSGQVWAGVRSFLHVNADNGDEG
jgi:hypothetical protein